MTSIRAMLETPNPCPTLKLSNYWAWVVLRSANVREFQELLTWVQILLAGERTVSIYFDSCKAKVSVSSISFKVQHTTEDNKRSLKEKNIFQLSIVLARSKTSAAAPERPQNDILKVIGQITWMKSKHQRERKNEQKDKCFFSPLTIFKIHSVPNMSSYQTKRPQM